MPKLLLLRPFSMVDDSGKVKQSHYATQIIRNGYDLATSKKRFDSAVKSNNTINKVEKGIGQL